ncbi:putative acetyltransferase [Pseudoruegeria aquimaris]|uniref:Putative acetyltransferase n=1 Tax=Pseudoruegeria aquimaris TaxID=393663 RepID=A0A1Y5SAU4_9RHOB|nr:GNAT family N-acetyltransferase [Pseudoruegeria aquimaris]SLN36518.1 putative acetyltransferase [Pseudoruegeria aquimaris]
MSGRIRPYLKADTEALREICIRTGAGGEDARGVEAEPGLLPEIFLDPYLRHSPAHAFVVEDDAGPCGYAVGVPDSRAFAAWQEAQWWPRLRAAHRDPGPDRGRWQSSDWLRRWVHCPPEALPDALAGWPAHGHIDLLPRAQGAGLARPLMETLLDSLARAGAPGIHLGVAAGNARALRFYEKLGFVRVPDVGGPGAVFVARSLPTAGSADAGA